MTFLKQQSKAHKATIQFAISFKNVKTSLLRFFDVRMQNCQAEEEKLRQQGKNIAYYRQKLERILIEKAHERVIAVSNRLPLPDGIAEKLTEAIAIPSDTNRVEDNPPEEAEAEGETEDINFGDSDAEIVHKDK
jgi:hypothetical protein